MVQVLPGVPTFGSRLAAVLGNAGENIGKGITQRRARNSLDELLNPQQSQATNPGQSPQGQADQQQQQSPINPLETVRAYNLAEQAYGPEGAKLIANSISQKQLQQQKAQDRRQQAIEDANRAAEHKFEEAEQKPKFEAIGANRVAIPEALAASDRVIDAVSGGDLGPSSAANLGQFLSEVGVPSSITNALQSVESKEFNSGMKQLIGHVVTESFRGASTKRQLQLVEQMQAQVGVRKEANLAAAFAGRSELEIKQKEVDLYDQFREDGYSPSQALARTKKPLKEFRDQIGKEYFQILQELKDEMDANALAGK